MIPTYNKLELEKKVKASERYMTLRSQLLNFEKRITKLEEQLNTTTTDETEDNTEEIITEDEE